MQGLRYCCIYFENLRWTWKRLITAPEFTEWEWSVAERRIFRCGAATSGDRLRVRFSPFAICNRGNLSGIDRGYADPVIVHEYVPENDALHLTLRQFVADFSFFRGAKKLSILALSKQSPVPLRLWTSPASRSVVLNASLVYWLPPRSLWKIAPQTFSVLQSKLRHGSDAEFLLLYCCPLLRWLWLCGVPVKVWKIHKK